VASTHGSMMRPTHGKQNGRSAWAAICSRIELANQRAEMKTASSKAPRGSLIPKGVRELIEDA